MEIPILLISHRIIQRFGLKVCLGLGLFAHCFKFIFLTFVTIQTPVWLIIFSQITHGIFFGAFYPALVTFINLATPRELNNTGQSLFIASTYAVGAVLGFWLNGFLLNFCGFSGIFMINSILIIFSIIAYLTINLNRMVLYER